VPARLALLTAALLFLSGCGGDGNGGSDQARPPGLPTTGAPVGTTTITTGACVAPPPPAAPLAWLPADLPLPPGSYPTREYPSEGRLHRGLLYVPVSISEFVRFALAEWPGRGYLLGRGESEPGEAEDGFRKGAFAGAFRARTAYCDRTELLLVYGQATAPGSPTTGPTTTTSSPLR
jgi:hypothetical protein